MVREVLVSPVSEVRVLRLTRAVQEALTLLPLLLGPTEASPLRDRVNDSDQGGEDHGRESDEGQGHEQEGRGVEFMPASYRTG